MNRIVFLLIFLTFSLTGCVAEENIREKKFSDIYKDCEMNSIINIDFKKRVNDPQRFDFVVRNSSSQEYVFSYGKGLEIWSFQENEWAKVSNGGEDYGSDSLYVAGNDHRVFPIYPLFEQKATIRVVVTGTFSGLDLDQDDCIGGYNDYQYIP